MFYDKKNYKSSLLCVIVCVWLGFSTKNWNYWWKMSQNDTCSFFFIERLWLGIQNPQMYTFVHFKSLNIETRSLLCHLKGLSQFELYYKCPQLHTVNWVLDHDLFPNYSCDVTNHAAPKLFITCLFSYGHFFFRQKTT